MKKHVAIVGGGPAGLSAAVQARSEGLEPLVFEKAVLGGLARAAYWIRNLAEYPNGISGQDFIEGLLRECDRLNVRIIREEVISVSRQKDGFFVWTGTSHYRVAAVVLATGTRPVRCTLVAGDAFGACRLHADARGLPDRLSGESVLISGGGDVAFDTAMTALDRGARVQIAYRGTAATANEWLRTEVSRLAIQQYAGFELQGIIPSGDRFQSIFKNKGRSEIFTTTHVVICHGRDPDIALWDSIARGTRAEAGWSGCRVPGLYACGEVVHGRNGSIQQAILQGRGVVQQIQRKVIADEQ